MPCKSQLRYHLLQEMNSLCFHPGWLGAFPLEVFVSHLATCLTRLATSWGQE